MKLSPKTFLILGLILGAYGLSARFDYEDEQRAACMARRTVSNPVYYDPLDNTCKKEKVYHESK